ncbi:MAG: hypothetical protein ACFFAN_10375 [Promethearchaeota archaeon]
MRLYQKAKAAVDDQIDVKIKTVQVYGICDYNLEGEALDKCPIYSAKKELFKSF